MASLIKNQILKHLSKFTKNLSPDKLQLSAIKGSCEVTGIELNEEILMDLLELPVWMSLTKAHCNYASIKIQWMKLKTIPIFILLDEVTIEVSTCENFRSNNQQGSLNQFNQESGSYGFTQKVIDGISLSINSVNIQFTSNVFSASFELTRINIESRNCLWRKVNDLSKTRIRDTYRGQVLIFKHIEWQTLRFVAKSEANAAIGQAPLRLIANQASCRIKLKKRLTDCAVLAARIMLIFDDLLWVLTDSQLLSALHFADYLGNLIKKAPRSKKIDNNENNMKNKIINLNSNTNVKSANLTNSISLLFGQHDLFETSHHIIICRIEVHLMDDLGPFSQRSQCYELKDGGALQMSFYKLFIDLYPYHRIENGNDDRTRWFRYNDPSPQRNSFIMHKLNCFFKKQQAYLKNENSKFEMDSLKTHLISQVLIIRLKDYSIGCVSTNLNSRTRNDATAKLINFDNSSVLPENVYPIYIEMNNYFFSEPFDKLNFKMPEPNIFAAFAPMKIYFEPLTILWINSFFANLHNALIKLQEAFPMPNNRSPEKPNIRVEILMPTIVFQLNNDFNFKYESLEIKVSKIVLYNCDSFINKEYFKGLDNLMKLFSNNIDFFYEHSNYPWLSCDMKPISTEFIEKINRLFLTNSVSSPDINATNFDIDFFAIHIEPIWIEMKALDNPIYDTLLEPVNIKLWLDQSLNAKLNLNIFAQFLSPIKLQLNHDQFLFLITLLQMVGDFTSNLNYDTYMIHRSQYKKDLELNKGNSQEVPKYTLEIEENIIKKIFKNSAFVTNLPQVDIFVILKKEEFIVDQIEDDNCQTNLKVDAVSNDCKSINVIENQSGSESNFFKQNLDELEDCLNQPINGTETDKNSRDSGMTKSLSDMNGDMLKQPEKSLIYFKKNSFSSGNFDTSSSRIHYTADNDDALSISDFSADESDHQSMIALINGEPDLLDEILTDKVEVAIDIMSNLDEELENNKNGILNEFLMENNEKVPEITKSYNVDVLHVKVKNLDLIQQSSRGFLSQIFINGTLENLEELQKLSKDEFLEQTKSTINNNSDVKKEIEDNDYDNKSENRITLRIDSFSKGTLKDELISVFVSNLKKSLNKISIDMLVDFFNDDINERVAPMAILLQNVDFKIIDCSVRVPPMVFNVPKLGLTRNKENRWLVEMLPNNDAPFGDHLLKQHLRIFERNLIYDVSDLIKEQDRLNRTDNCLDYTNRNDTQEILNQVLNQKELLLNENELLRKENENLRKKLNQSF